MNPMRSLLAALLLAIPPSSVLAQAAPAAARTPPTVDSLFRLVRAELDGERAKELVAYVAERWRVPGNRGFDESIRRVERALREAGYVEESAAGPDARLTYRVERRPMTRPAWEPVDASLAIAGDDTPVLRWATNRNMLAINSFSTPEGGVEAELVDVGRGRPEDFAGRDVAGTVVLADAPVGRLFEEAVRRRGALGVLAYAMPPYVQPERHRTSIQFGSVPLDSARRAWGILLSYDARERLRAALAGGAPVRVRVSTSARQYAAEELTLVADVRGERRPEERFVFSAHVQEPGANDNASGVGAQAEMARTLARLVQDGRFRPARTITFLWGDEIRSTRRYLREDSVRARGVRWGMSLDMVGEDTERTGGTFLIEKMPDPSAVWTRGDERHSEWGGEPIPVDSIRPHYFNDFVLARALDQARATGWVVRTNPFEGGSDHTPFLDAGKPGILLWHFTDVFYHTDNDRIENVSARTLANVGTTALVTAMTLASADGATTRALVTELEAAALRRLATEDSLSRVALAAGAAPADERTILATWTDYYARALATMAEIEVGGASAATRARIAEAQRRVEAEGRRLVEALER